MKKWFILLVLLISPFMVYAKTTTKEDIMNFIDNIQNVQVDDNIRINNTSITDKEISIELLDNNRIITKTVPYSWNDNILTIVGGTITKGEEPINNQYAFYLYAILENKTTSPYEEEHYYNPSLLKKLVETNTKEVIEDHNTGDTFSIYLKEQTPNIYQINYQFNLVGDDASIVSIEEGQDELFKNPETGNIHFYVTVLLIIMLGIAAYTFWQPEPIKKGE
jgi:hypothetical protein